MGADRPASKRGSSRRGLPAANEKSAGAIALAVRFRDLFDLPKCPDERRSKAGYDAKEQQGQGWG
jgi:hypothetical protein